MSITKKFSIVVMDTEKISDVNNIILKYAHTVAKSSSHILFNATPVFHEDIVHDLTFFHLQVENEQDLDKTINELINEINKITTDYSLRNEDNGKMIVYVKYVGALDIKFDNIKIIKKGTYKKIDELKYTKTEFGYCKGYKPLFRPLESKPIEDVIPKTENIYLFAKSSENMTKLIDYLSEKIREIDSDLIIEYRQFT